MDLEQLRAALARGPKPAEQRALVPTAPAAIVRVPCPTGGINQVEITDVGLDQIRRDRANGVSIESIARRLGMDRATFRRLRQRDLRVEDALSVGHAAAQDELVGILMRKARSAESDRDQIIAALFLLKSMHGFRDTGPLDGTAATVNIQVNNIESMTTDEMRARVAELMEARERLLANGDQENQAVDAEVVSEAGDE